MQYRREEDEASIFEIFMDRKDYMVRMMERIIKIRDEHRHQRETGVPAKVRFSPASPALTEDAKKLEVNLDELSDNQKRELTMALDTKNTITDFLSMAMSSPLLNSNKGLDEALTYAMDLDFDDEVYPQNKK